MKYSVFETSFLTVTANKEHYLIIKLFRNSAVSGILKRNPDLYVYGGILLNTVAFGIIPLAVYVLTETSENLSID